MATAGRSSSLLTTAASGSQAALRKRAHHLPPSHPPIPALPRSVVLAVKCSASAGTREHPEPPHAAADRRGRNRTREGREDCGRLSTKKEAAERTRGVSPVTAPHPPMCRLPAHRAEPGLPAALLRRPLSSGLFRRETRDQGSQRSASCGASSSCREATCSSTHARSPRLGNWILRMSHGDVV